MKKVLVLDFGGQYKELIARRVREANVFCEVVSYLTPLSEILEKKPVGIILSGGPASALGTGIPARLPPLCPVAASLLSGLRLLPAPCAIFVPPRSCDPP